jgi:hypothetical protein
MAVGSGKRYRNEHWGVFETDPASPLLDMQSGSGWDRAVQIEQERFDRQNAARMAAKADVGPAESMPAPSM